MDGETKKVFAGCSVARSVAGESTGCQGIYPSMAPFDQYPMQRNAEITHAECCPAVPSRRMLKDRQKDWRELCAAVTNESDSTKLTSLVQELIEALDQGEQKLASSRLSRSTQWQRNREAA